MSIPNRPITTVTMMANTHLLPVVQGSKKVVYGGKPSSGTCVSPYRGLFTGSAAHTRVGTVSSKKLIISAKNLFQLFTSS